MVIAGKYIVVTNILGRWVAVGSLVGRTLGRTQTARITHLGSFGSQKTQFYISLDIEKNIKNKKSIIYIKRKTTFLTTQGKKSVAKSLYRSNIAYYKVFKQRPKQRPIADPQRPKRGFSDPFGTRNIF